MYTIYVCILYSPEIVILTLQTSRLVTEVQIKHLFLIVDYIENEGLET